MSLSKCEWTNSSYVLLPGLYECSKKKTAYFCIVAVALWWIYNSHLGRWYSESNNGIIPRVSDRREKRTDRILEQHSRRALFYSEDFICRYVSQISGSDFINSKHFIQHGENISFASSARVSDLPTSNNVIFGIQPCWYYLAMFYRPKNSNLPYVSWSHLLADLISSTHAVLCDVVAQSQSVGSALSILQCLVIFLRNTPYHRLNEGILKNIVYSISPLLKHVG